MYVYWSRQRSKGSFVNWTTFVELKRILHRRETHVVFFEKR